MLAVLLACGIASQTIAQEQDAPVTPPPTQPEPLAAPGDAFNSRPIRRVDIIQPGADGTGLELPGASLQFAMNQLRSRAGEPYAQETVSGDISRLSRTGRYSSVDASVRQLSDGGVVLIFLVVEQPIIEDVQVVGNNQLGDQDLAPAFDMLSGTPVDPFQLDRAARRIEALYREKGFYNAQVDWDKAELRDNGIVLFRIREGDRLKVTDIRFDGAQSIPIPELRRQIKTKKVFLFNRAPLDDETLDADVAAIYNYYRDRGFLDVRVDRRVQPAPNNREAILTFFVEEGPLFHLRDVIIETTDEQPVMTAEQVAGLISIRTGDVYSINRLRDAIATLRAAYHTMGYSDVQIEQIELRDETDPRVDLVLNITQGQFRLAGEVLIGGNETTKAKVIRRIVDDAGVRPGRPLDRTAIQDAEKELSQSRLFERFPEPPRATLQLDRSPARAGASADRDDPDSFLYRDVLVEVKETDTGELNFGAAVNSDSGLVGRIGLTQRNFDIADTPDTFGDLFSGESFRGAGQRFQIEALPGERVETYTISLTEPALLDSDYSASAAAFFRDRDFEDYDEERYGGRFTLGRRFGTRWVGNAHIRLESVDLRDIDPSKPVDIFEVEDRNTLTALGFTLQRTTLNDNFRPTRGARTELGVEQVGALGGSFDFTKLSAEHEVFVPVYENFAGHTTVFSAKVATGYIPQGQDNVPVYERLYLGGQSFRGFDFRGIGPVGIRNDTGELGEDQVGGIWSFYLGTQIVHPVFEETVSVVGFIDSGTVATDVGFDSYRLSAGLGIRLYVPQLSPAPIGFDFGFPVLEEPTDDNRVFTFFVDLPF